ncbi:hypothetical protein OIU77_027093 [Salix suchowensis]|uniref:Uncharacterized protein n=1 Tax=Salix suchowensis TaxID=1278906 RepID=A0ABQ9BSL3_9ROSI|nr:hypothetical protein OIU77_027093 [Salix suchowensis]
MVVEEEGSDGDEEMILASMHNFDTWNYCCNGSSCRM